MKRSVFTRVVATVALVIILLDLPLMVSAYPTSYELNFPTVVQENSQWCWAACCCAVIEYYGGNVSQSAFVNNTQGNLDNEPSQIEGIQQGLLNYSIGSTLVDGTIPLSQIRINTYSNRRPVVAGWRRRYSVRYGHMVVIIGYIEDSSLNEQCVVYMDPADGEIHTGSYSWFVGNSEYSWYLTLTSVREV